MPIIPTLGVRKTNNNQENTLIYNYIIIKKRKTNDKSKLKNLYKIANQLIY